MKKLLFFNFLLFILGCNQEADNSKQLRAEVDSLNYKLKNSYTPGLGEFMSGIQTHHAKLWFAGINNNWTLADFEINEIRETLDDIQKFNTDRPEIKSIGMINPAIDSVSNAIRQKDQQLFRNTFTFLTNTCNNCHKATDHAFNVVTLPSNLPVTNQDFKPIQ